MDTRKEHLFLSVFFGEVVAVERLAAQAAAEVRHGDLVLTSEPRRIRKRPEIFVVLYKLRVNLVFQLQKLPDQLLGRIEHIADYLNLVLAEVAVDVSVLAERVLCLSKRAA